MIYQRETYIILKVGNGFIVHNKAKEFSEGHTHIKSFDIAKTLIDCCIKKRLPKTRNHYLLESAIRISDDVNFKEKVQTLLAVRRNKRG